MQIDGDTQDHQPPMSEVPAEADTAARIAADARLKSILAKVGFRLIPFMLLLYVAAYLDRINVSFAGLQMNRDLGFSDAVFGLGAGIFFVGYFLFGVPANMMIEKLGARRWISLIMVVWGSISASMTLVTNESVFYLLRALLGVAEAGFFPGMILYLTFWFPRREHGMAVARFMTAIPAAGVLGGLVASRVLSINALGLAGWKWLFLTTGSMSFLLGVVVFFYLTDKPAQASWLSADDRDCLTKALLLDRSTSPTKALAQEPEPIFKNKSVWMLALIYFLLTLGMYGFQLWLPQIIKSFGQIDDSTTAMLSAIPAVFQALGMLMVAGHSDRKGERRWHVALSAWLAAGGLLATSVSPNPLVALASLSLTAFGLWGVVGPFWAIPTATLPPLAAASGIAFINSVGNLGGFAGPYIVGLIKNTTHSFFASLAALACSLVLSGLLVLSTRKDRKMNESVDV